MNEIEEIMNSGKIYNVMDLTSKDTHFFEYLQKMETYNSTGYSSKDETTKRLLLKELFAEIGEGSYIQPPYHAMWGGHHVHLGKTFI